MKAVSGESDASIREGIIRVPSSITEKKTIPADTSAFDKHFNRKESHKKNQVPEATQLRLPAKPPQARAGSNTIHATTATDASKKAPQNTRTKPQRPGLERRRTTARTRYIDMLLGLDHVSPLHNILASASVWILLAGYIVFPATFTKLDDKISVDEQKDSDLVKDVKRGFGNLPLLYVAAFACGLGVAGCLWLWWKHRKNYVWVINRLFLPALLNSVAGVVSTLVNVYSAQDGQYSTTAKVTIIVTSACSAVTAALFLLYNMVMLKVVKRRHERETEEVDRDNNTKSSGDEETIKVGSV